jgi:hypothetical protein
MGRTTRSSTVTLTARKSSKTGQPVSGLSQAVHHNADRAPLAIANRHPRSPATQSSCAPEASSSGSDGTADGSMVLGRARLGKAALARTFLAAPATVFAERLLMLALLCTFWIGLGDMRLRCLHVLCGMTARRAHSKASTPGSVAPRKGRLFGRCGDRVPRSDEGSIAEWVMILVMAVGITLFIWSIAQPLLGQILRTALAKLLR